LATDREVELLVPAAGLEVNGAFERTSLEQELQGLEINVMSTFSLGHHLRRPMAARKRHGKHDEFHAAQNGIKK